MNIAEWLHSLELPQYEQLFIDQAITLEVLPSLTNDDLKELGVVVLGHRKRMLLALAELSAQPSSAPNEQPSQPPSVSDGAETTTATAALAAPMLAAKSGAGRSSVLSQPLVLALGGLVTLGLLSALVVWLFSGTGTSGASTADGEVVAVSLACEAGQLVVDSVCCWPGQTLGETDTCVGTPLCPDGTLAQGEGCEPGCEPGKTLQTEHCCWVGQAWDDAAGTCAGEPSPGVLVLTSNIGGASVKVGGVERATTLAGASIEVELGQGSQSLEVERPGYVSLQLELSLLPGERLERPLTLEVAIPKGYVRIEPGTFMMGSPSGEHGRWKDERQHEVTLTRGFFMKATEVTQGEYKALMGNNPSRFKSCGENCPVEQVNWREAVDYCQALTRSEGLEECYGDGRRLKSLDCAGYRLPTESEWEYAARAGTTGARYGDLSEIGWCNGSRTHAVGQKKANAWGLYDMIGNVDEWTGDWYGSYPSGPVTDPLGRDSGSSRVRRGGSWGRGARRCRAANRISISPSIRDVGLGFRPVRSSP